MSLSQWEIEWVLREPVISQLRTILADFYEPEQFGMWLALPHPRFGKSVLEMIHEGRAQEVLDAVAQLTDGVYA